MFAGVSYFPRYLPLGYLKALRRPVSSPSHRGVGPGRSAVRGCLPTREGFAMLGLFTRSRRRPCPVRRAPRHRLFGLQRLETRDWPTAIGALTLFGSDGLDSFTSNFALSADSGSSRPALAALSITVSGEQIAGGNWVLSGTVSGTDQVGGLAVTLTGSDSAFGTQSTTTESDGSRRILWSRPITSLGSATVASVPAPGATATANTSIG